MLGPLGAAVGQGAAATNPTHHAHYALRIAGICAFWPISVQQVQRCLGRIGGHGGRGGLGGMVGWWDAISWCPVGDGGRAIGSIPSRAHRNLNAGGYVCWLIGPWRCTVGQSCSASRTPKTLFPCCSLARASRFGISRTHWVEGGDNGT